MVEGSLFSETIGNVDSISSSLSTTRRASIQLPGGIELHPEVQDRIRHFLAHSVLLTAAISVPGILTDLLTARGSLKTGHAMTEHARYVANSTTTIVRFRNSTIHPNHWTAEDFEYVDDPLDASMVQIFCRSFLLAMWAVMAWWFVMYRAQGWERTRGSVLAVAVLAALAVLVFNIIYLVGYLLRGLGDLIGNELVMAVAEALIYGECLGRDVLMLLLVSISKDSPQGIISVSPLLSPSLPSAPLRSPALSPSPLQLSSHYPRCGLQHFHEASDHTVASRPHALLWLVRGSCDWRGYRKDVPSIVLPDEQGRGSGTHALSTMLPSQGS